MNVSTAPEPIELFGLSILPCTRHQALLELATAAERFDGHARVVVTPNADHIVQLSRTPEFKSLYARADYLFADGMPLIWASRWLGRSLPERVTGADLTIDLCAHALQAQWRIIVLGGEPGQEQLLTQQLQARYPGLQIQVLAPSMQFDPYGQEAQNFAIRIAQHRPHIVFVCLGYPKQERWALHFASTLPGGLVLCVGAAIRFAAGLEQRAPKFMQRLGLEWLWRLASDPRRLWRRYLKEDPYFFLLCWKEWRMRH